MVKRCGPLNEPAALESCRVQIRKDWANILGPLPQAPANGLKVITLSTERLATCTRSIIQYEAEPGRHVKAYLIRPIDDKPTTRPGVVVFHPTTSETMKVVAGTGGRPEQHIALKLVEHGYVAICPANYLWEQPSWDAAAKAARARHPKSTGMATMLADGMRAVDVLLQTPGVDPDHIGTIGHSLGAKEALYLLAFDKRVSMGAASEGGVGIHSSNWDANWYLGPQIKKPGFSHDHDELMLLIAPRPFLVFGGEIDRAADGDRTWPYICLGNHVNRVLGEPPRFGLINHRQGHKFYPDMVEKAMEWFDAYLPVQ